MLSFILCRTLASWPDWDFFVGELAHVAPNERMYNFCQTSEHSFGQFIEESCSVASKGLAATFLSASLGTHAKNNQVPERKFSIMRPNDSQKPTLSFIWYHSFAMISNIILWCCLHKDWKPETIPAAVTARRNDSAEILKPPALTAIRDASEVKWAIFSRVASNNCSILQESSTSAKK